MALSTLAIVLLVAAALVWLGAIGLLVIGLRGRRVDDHPLCRRCGFDLTGKPDTTVHCGECGLDLAAPNAVRVGHRRRRPVLVGVGLAGGLAGLTLAVLLAAAVQQNVNWQTYKPLAWLLHDLTDSSPAVRRLAVDEIDRRRGQSVFSPNDLDRVVDRILLVQADLTLPWDGRLGEIVKADHKAGHLSAARWERFVRNAVAGMKLVSARARVGRGEPLNYWVADSNGRFCNGADLMAYTDTGDTLVSIDATDLPRRPGGGYSGTGIGNGGSRSGSSVDLAPVLGRLADGPHTLRLRRKTTVHEGGHDKPPVLTVDLDSSIGFVLQSGPSVKTVPDATAGAGVLAAVKVDAIRRNAGSDYYYFTVSIGATPVPVGVGCRISLRSGDREWATSSRFACPAGTDNHGYGTGFELKDLPPAVRQVDMVFTPDPAAAAGTTDTFEIWDQPFTIKNVPVK